jgi:hypothetical protein
MILCSQVGLLQARNFRKMIFTDASCGRRQIHDPQRRGESEATRLSKCEEETCFMHTLAGKENERILLGDGVEITLRLTKSYGKTRCVYNAESPVSSRCPGEGVYAVFPRRKDDIEPKRFRHGHSLEVNDQRTVLQAGSPKELYVLVSRNKTISWRATQRPRCPAGLRAQDTKAAFVYNAQPSARSGLVDDLHQNSIRSHLDCRSRGIMISVRGIYLRTAWPQNKRDDAASRRMLHSTETT